MTATQAPQPHVLIIGAGITGLLLAQSLRKEDISFAVYERDPTPTHRGAGWGLALHWALDAFLSLVPIELQERLPETFVDPNLDGNGRFPFFDLSTGEERYENLSPKRVRLSREKLRRLMMHDLDVKVCVALSIILNRTLIYVVEQEPHACRALANGRHSLLRRWLFRDWNSCGGLRWNSIKSPESSMRSTGYLLAKLRSLGTITGRERNILRRASSNHKVPRSAFHARL